MKYYTSSLLTFSLTILILQPLVSAKNSRYSVYDKCEEYYDSRGFYHKICDENKFNKRKLKKVYQGLLHDVDPGTGEELNTTEGPASNSAIDDIIQDDQIDTSSNASTEEVSTTLTPAIVEEPELEFGRQDP